MEKYCSIEVCKMNVSPNEYLGKIYILVNGILGVRNRLIVVKRPVNSIGFDARVKRIYLEYLRRGYSIDFCFHSYFYPRESFDISLIIGDTPDANLSHKPQTKASHYRR
jgi:hypothetical protein